MTRWPACLRAALVMTVLPAAAGCGVPEDAGLPGTASDETAGAFHAGGNSPDWDFTLAGTGEARLTWRNGERAHFSFPGFVPRREVFMLSAHEDGHDILIQAEKITCRDDASGRDRPHTVLVTIDGTSLAGCGEWLDPAGGEAD